MGIHPVDGALVCVLVHCAQSRKEREEYKDQCPKQRDNAQKGKGRKKTLAKIQTPSLTPKPLIDSMKQIRQREGRNPEKRVKLKRGLACEDGPPQYAHKKSTKERLRFPKLTMSY